MWNCEHCGCQSIARDLGFCPMCFQERDMPKITTAGGVSNADAGPGEPGYTGPKDVDGQEQPDQPDQPERDPQDSPDSSVERPADPDGSQVQDGPTEYAHGPSEAGYVGQHQAE